MGEVEGSDALSQVVGQASLENEKLLTSFRSDVGEVSMPLLLLNNKEIQQVPCQPMMTSLTLLIDNENQRTMTKVDEEFDQVVLVTNTSLLTIFHPPY